MTARRPEVMSVQSARYTGPTSAQREDGIFVQIALRGIKGEPIETHALTPVQALRLINELSVALLRLKS